MKCTKIVFTMALAVSIGTNASGDHHRRSVPQDVKNPIELNKKMMAPGYCEIEIVNRSYEPVHVTGTYLDGEWLEAFDIFPYEYPHYISLQYYGCQAGMYLTVSNFNNYVIYNGYTPVYQTVTIYPLVGQKQSVAKVQAKQK